MQPNAGGRSGSLSLADLRTELGADIRQLEEENGEFDMLMQQVQLEIERHQGRRSRLEQQIKELESVDDADPSELAEAHDDLLATTRREMLFDAQRQVLEGKQRVLARYLQRIVEIEGGLATVAGDRSYPAPNAGSGPRPLAGDGGPARMNQPATELRSREELRRDIVRRLHDGPAQSIANIGLQAEIVERLVEREDPRATEEIGRLRFLVQQALDATKEFIFEIRPMVLDDLGLGPTVRRVTADKARRSGIPVEFDSQGIERRLPRDLESAVYRSIEEAISAYLELKPPSVLVRFDWSGRELVTTVEGTWVRHSAEHEADRQAGPERNDDTPAALLAMMEEKRSADRAADRAARALPAERVAEIEHRAQALGMRLTMRDDGQAMELLVPMQAGT